MPSKIDHKVVNNEECKRCATCKEFKPLSEFYKDGGHAWDGLVVSCKICIKSKRQNDPRTRAVRAWNDLRKRVINGEPAYKSRNICINISRDDFITWYMIHSFPHCHVDRIDNEANYVVGNLQMLTIREHNFKHRADRLRLENVTEPDGYRYCYHCKTIKKYSEFYTKKLSITEANPMGLRVGCKACEHTKRKTRKGT